MAVIEVMSEDEIQESGDAIINESGFFVYWEDITLPDGLVTSVSHSVGLAEKNLPEVIVFGLEDIDAGPLVTRVGNMFLEGRFQYDTPIDVQLNVKASLKEASWALAEDFVTRALLRVGREFDVVQIVLPDTNGKYPWNLEFDKDKAIYQIPLYSLN